MAKSSQSKSVSNKKHVLKQILTEACVIYTIVVLLLCGILLFMAENGTLAPASFLFVLPFAVCIAVANALRQRTGLSALLKFILHFVLTVGGFYFFLYLPAFSGTPDSVSIVVLFVFAVFYLIVYGLVRLFTHRWERQIRLESDYKSQFSAASDERYREK